MTMKKPKKFAVKLVKSMSRERIGTLPRAQVLPRKRKTGRERIKDQE